MATADTTHGPDAWCKCRSEGDHNDATLLFKRGAYTVLIDPTRIGGTSADYPTEKPYLTLAQAI
jgi:hypothetical protein